MINAPSSKSYAQRAIAAALLSNGLSSLRGIDLSDDTSAALDVSARLGAKITHQGDVYSIQGGLNPLSDLISIGESGLSTRLFTPIAALCSRAITITGHGSIMKRPMDMMISPLQSLGAHVDTNNGFLPFTVCGPLVGGRTVEVDGSLSSQFLTGLLMALPLVDGHTTLIVKDLQSKPYIDITLDVLQQFGIQITNDNYKTFHIAGNQYYTPTDYVVEGDWSGASCLLVLRAISHANFDIGNLNRQSVQADRAIERAISLAGSDLHCFDFDATDCPDLFPALVALAAHCVGDSHLKGTNRLTHKESDRAVVLRDEFARLGIVVDISTPDVMMVRGGEVGLSAEIDPHGDHRIAMAAAVAAWNRHGVSVLNRSVVNKSYPAFWDDLALIVGLI